MQGSLFTSRTLAAPGVWTTREMTCLFDRSDRESTDGMDRVFVPTRETGERRWELVAAPKP